LSECLQFFQHALGMVSANGVLGRVGQTVVQQQGADEDPDERVQPRHHGDGRRQRLPVASEKLVWCRDVLRAWGFPLAVAIAWVGGGVERRR